MRGRHVHLVLSIMSVASLCACEYKHIDVLDKWVRQEGRAPPEDEQSAVQGTPAAAGALYSSPQPHNASQSSQLSIGSPQWSSNSSRTLYNGFLKAFGLQQSKQIPRFLQTPLEDSSVRRRSTKEITTPHIIHQVTHSSCCILVMSPNCELIEQLAACSVSGPLPLFVMLLRRMSDVLLLVPGLMQYTVLLLLGMKALCLSSRDLTKTMAS